MKQAAAPLINFFNVIENFNEAVFFVDELMFVRYVNRAAIDMFGYEENEWVGLHIFHLPNYELHADFLKDKVERFSKAVPEKYEMEVFKKSGEKIWISVVSAPVINMNNEFNGSLSIISDITEKKKQDQELELFHKLINYSSDMMFLICPFSGTFINANNASCQTLGYSRNQIRQMKITEVSLNNNNIEIWRKHVSLLREQKKMLIESEYIKSNGKTFPVEVNTRLVNIENNEYIIAVARDITKRVESQKQLKKAERLKDEKINELNTFLYKITHDLKSPLASLLGLLNLAEKNPGNHQFQKYKVMMKQSVKKMENILDDLNNIIEISCSNIRPDIIDFQKLFEEIKSEIQCMPGSGNINFTTEINNITAFHTDKKLLTTILQNLIHNSIKYKKNIHLFIHVNISEDVKGVKIEILDNGAGMPQEIHGKIFDMFFRGTELSNGTGLGLYIVKNSVQKLFGKIQVTSKKGEGSAFTILLPDLLKYAVSHGTEKIKTNPLIYQGDEQ